MAQYKVPQDVEAEDKLLGPFTFRQFIYLIITTALIALAWGLFQLFPLLVVIPLPPIVFFGALALPLKKDQPMETYLTAIVSYYLKPHKRLWTAGQPNSTIAIAAPKIDTGPRTKDLSEDEVTHRLSFLSNLIDSNGQLMTGGQNTLQTDVLEAAANTQDMFEAATSIGTTLDTVDQTRHQEMVAKMSEMIKQQEINPFDTPPQIQTFGHPSVTPIEPTVADEAINSGESEINPESGSPEPRARISEDVRNDGPSEALPEQDLSQTQPTPQPVAQPTPDVVNLIEQKDFSVETIAKEAQRLKEKRDNEVFISLRGDK
jgi:hypothetical protein